MAMQEPQLQEARILYSIQTLNWTTVHLCLKMRSNKNPLMTSCHLPEANLSHRTSIFSLISRSRSLMKLKKKRKRRVKMKMLMKNSFKSIAKLHPIFRITGSNLSLATESSLMSSLKLSMKAYRQSSASKDGVDTLICFCTLRLLKLGMNRLVMV